MKRYLLTTGIVAASLISNQVLAGTMGVVSNYWNTSSNVVTLSLSPAWASPGQTQTFYLTPSIEKTYSPKKSSSALFDGEIFLGRQLQPYHDIQGQ